MTKNERQWARIAARKLGQARSALQGGTVTLPRFGWPSPKDLDRLALAYGEILAVETAVKQSILADLANEATRRATARRSVFSPAQEAAIAAHERVAKRGEK